MLLELLLALACSALASSAGPAPAELVFKYADANATGALSVDGLTLLLVGVTPALATDFINEFVFRWLKNWLLARCGLHKRGIPDIWCCFYQAYSWRIMNEAWKVSLNYN